MPNLTPPNHSIRVLLDRAERDHFYGTIAVRYENGKPVHIRREESILPSNINLTENPEHHDTQRNTR